MELSQLKVAFAIGLLPQLHASYVSHLLWCVVSTAPCLRRADVFVRNRNTEPGMPLSQYLGQRALPTAQIQMVHVKSGPPRMLMTFGEYSKETAYFVARTILQEVIQKICTQLMHALRGLVKVIIAYLMRNLCRHLQERALGIGLQ